MLLLKKKFNKNPKELAMTKCNTGFRVLQFETQKLLQ